MLIKSSTRQREMVGMSSRLFPIVTNRGRCLQMTTNWSLLPPSADCFRKLQPNCVFVYIYLVCEIIRPARLAAETLTGGVLCVVDGHFRDSRTCVFFQRCWNLSEQQTTHYFVAWIQGGTYLSSKEWNEFDWDWSLLWRSDNHRWGCRRCTGVETLHPGQH